MVKRHAFTLLELLFAIIIIGISVYSLPMMIHATSKAVESNLVQEAIFAASAELNEATTFRWDENSIEATSSLSKIIDGNCSTRTGLINQPLHRQCLNNPNTLPTNSDEGDNDDIDDFDHDSQPIFFGPDIVGAQSYKNDYNSTLSVKSNNVVFNSSQLPSPNIKEIIVTIFDQDSNKIVELRTYSANIGEVDYFKRTF